MGVNDESFDESVEQIWRQRLGGHYMEERHTSTATTARTDTSGSSGRSRPDRSEKITNVQPSPKKVQGHSIGGGMFLGNRAGVILNDDDEFFDDSIKPISDVVIPVKEYDDDDQRDLDSVSNFGVEDPIAVYFAASAPMQDIVQRHVLKGRWRKGVCLVVMVILVVLVGAVAIGVSRRSSNPTSSSSDAESVLPAETTTSTTSPAVTSQPEVLTTSPDVTSQPEVPTAAPTHAPIQPSGPPTFSPFMTKVELQVAVKAYLAMSPTTEKNALATAITNRYGHVEAWDVTRISDFSNAFKDQTAFNGDVSNWNVTHAQTIAQMFRGATSFRRNLCAWGQRVPASVNVTDMFRDTACPNTSSPTLVVDPASDAKGKGAKDVFARSVSGPWCYNCK